MRKVAVYVYYALKKMLYILMTYDLMKPFLFIHCINVHCICVQMCAIYYILVCKS